MKILLINDYASKMGGDLAYVLNLKNELKKRGIEASVHFDQSNR